MAKGDYRGMPYEKPGPPKGEAYGIAAVTKALHGLDFPASKQALLERAGNQTIEYRKGEQVSLRKLIDDIDKDSFESMAGIVSCISDALHEEGMTNQERKSA